jgi:hypothetical protein
MVRVISSDRALQFQTSNGLIVTGRVDSSSIGVVISPGQLSLLPSQITAISLPNRERSFRNHLSGSAELGYSLTRGNSQLSQSTVIASAAYRSEQIRLQTDLSSLFSKQSSAQSASSHSISSRLDMFFTRDAFAFTLGSLERDDREQLKLRSNLGTGIGYKLAHSEQVELSVLGGLTALHEDYRESDASQPARRRSSGEALAGLSLDRLKVGQIQLTAKASGYPNFLETGRVRATSTFGVRLPVVGRVVWGFRLFEKFDNRPRLGVKKHDYGAVSSLGLAF